jgi:hypothetical protein
VSQELQTIYTQYQSFKLGGGDNFTPSTTDGVVVSGNSVGVQVHADNSADFGAMLSQLQSDGLQVITSDATHATVEGMVSIDQLPAIAQIPQAMSITPMFVPIVH